MNNVEDKWGTSVRKATRLSCTLEDLIERAAALTAGGTRKILGITGAPGAGKSTVADAIADALDSDAARVGMDGFHLANSVLESQGTRDRKGAPETFDAGGYAHLLRRLRSNTDSVVYAPLFDRSLEESIGSAVPVPHDVRLVITEGNYLLLDAEGWRDGRTQIDEVWYLDVSEEERQRRLVRRHEAFGKAPEQARAWALGSDQRNADIVDSTLERADLVITLTGQQRPATLAQA